MVAPARSPKLAVLFIRRAPCGKGDFLVALGLRRRGRCHLQVRPGWCLPRRIFTLLPAAAYVVRAGLFVQIEALTPGQSAESEEIEEIEEIEEAAEYSGISGWGMSAAAWKGVDRGGPSEYMYDVRRTDYREQTETSLPPCPSQAWPYA